MKEHITSFSRGLRKSRCVSPVWALLGANLLLMGIKDQNMVGKVRVLVGPRSVVLARFGRRGVLQKTSTLDSSGC